MTTIEEEGGGVGLRVNALKLSLLGGLASAANAADDGAPPADDENGVAPGHNTVGLPEAAVSSSSAAVETECNVL